MTNEQITVQLDDMQAVEDLIAQAKLEVGFAAQGWYTLDRAEGRLAGLRVFTEQARAAVS